MQNPCDVEPPEDNDLFMEANIALQEPEIIEDIEDDETDDNDEMDEDDDELQFLNMQLSIINQAQRESGIANEDDPDEDMSEEESSEEEVYYPNSFPPDFMVPEEPHDHRFPMGCGSPNCAVCRFIQ